MNHYFPRLNLCYTAIPKNGCTSLLNYFIYLEKQLEFNKSTLFSIEQLSKLDFGNEKFVHYQNNDLFHEKYLISKEHWANIDTLKLTTLRNPYDRFASFWFDKVVNRRDSAYFEFNQIYFGGKSLIGIFEIRRMAKLFLSSIDLDNLHQQIDRHIKSQISYLENKQYDLLIDTELIRKIPSELAKLNPHYAKMEKVPIPHFNKSGDIRMKIFWDKDLKTIFEGVYIEDLNLYFKNKSKNL